MGIPFNGRSLTLFNENNNGYESLVSGNGIQGPYTMESGFLNYNEVCKMLNEEKWIVKRDDHYKVPYTFKSNQWVSYDDIQSIKDKVEFLRSKGLAGAMVWSIDGDDFRGACEDEQGNFPLLRTITNGLNNRSNCEYSLDEVNLIFVKNNIINTFLDLLSIKYRRYSTSFQVNKYKLQGKALQTNLYL